MELIDWIAILVAFLFVCIAYLAWDSWGGFILSRKYGFKSIEGFINFDHPLNGREVITFVDNLIKDYNKTHNETFITTGYEKRSLIKDIDSGKILSVNDSFYYRDVSFNYKCIDAKRISYLYNTRSWNYSLADFMINISCDADGIESQFTNWFDSEHFYPYIKISFAFGIADSKFFSKNHRIREKMLRDLSCEVSVKTTYPNK